MAQQTSYALGFRNNQDHFAGKQLARQSSVYNKQQQSSVVLILGGEQKPSSAPHHSYSNLHDKTQPTNQPHPSSLTWGEHHA